MPFRRIPHVQTWAVCVAAAFAAIWWSSPAWPADWADRALQRSLTAPLGLSQPPHPLDNPPTVEKIVLGRKLFHDRRLSLNGTMSCAMCHVPEQAFTNNELATSVGVEGRSGRRNAPSLLNVAYMRHLFHEGRETALETQYIAPLTARNEMANPSVGHVVTLLRQLPDYEGLFEAAFGAGPSTDRIGQALGAYQRSLVAADSRFDRWRFGGDADALSEAEKRGFALFTGKAGCAGCHHVGDDEAPFTDNDLHDIGYGWAREKLKQRPVSDSIIVEVAPGVRYPMTMKAVNAVGLPPMPDIGRYEVTQDPADRWKFRTPMLRNVAITGPYMHDGGITRLEDVIDFYNKGGAPHDGQDERLRPLHLTDGEIGDLRAFLLSLTSRNWAHLIDEARVAEPDNWTR